MSSGSATASIGHLPPEILSIIFTFVYVRKQNVGGLSIAEMMKAQAVGMPFPDTLESTWTPEEVISPSLFPFALAAVCTTWRNTMSAFPKFWTRLVMFANKSTILPDPSDLRTPAGLKQQLKWSGNLLLDVFITRLPDGGLDTVEDEGHIVRKAIDILEPHVARCKTISYDLIHNSSLPSIMTDLNHPTPHLSELYLNATLYSDKSNQSSQLIHHPTNFHFPNLEYLALDGHNFMDFCIYVPDWINRINVGEEEWPGVPLAISHYVERIGERPEGNTFWDKIADALPRIIHLDLSSIVIYDPPKRRGLDRALDWLGFHEVNAPFINEILHNVSYAEILKIIDCAIGEDIDCVVNAFQLTLETIPHSEDISPFLSRWCGFELVIVNCSSFNDATLDTLAHKPLNPAMANLSSLYIRDCANFTVAAAKRFVERQKAKFDEYGDADEAFSCLEVTGLGPHLRETERVWFQSNVPYFCWATDMAT